MATGSVFVTGSQVEEPPLPGGRYPREYVTACFVASGASVASLTYTFGASFGAAPSVFVGNSPGEDGGELADASLGSIWVSSITSSSVQFNANSAAGTNASFTATATWWFTE